MPLPCTGRAGSNTQHDDSAIDLFAASTTPHAGANTLLLRMMIYSTWKVEHVFVKGRACYRCFGDGFWLIDSESQSFAFFILPTNQRGIYSRTVSLASSYLTCHMSIPVSLFPFLPP